MSKQLREMTRAIERVADEYGASVEISRLKRHYRATLRINGKSYPLTIGGTPGDGSRALANTVAQARREIKKMLT